MADDSGRPTGAAAKPVIFISYSHKDEPEKPGPDDIAWLTFVQSFLAPVVKVGIFDIWVDQHLHGGDALDPEIKTKLAACDIFVLLASRFSLASTYVVETEIATMRRRQENKEDVHIFPIVLSPIPNAALKQLKDLVLKPKDGKPLSLMSKNDREVAMAGIADDIAAVAEKLAEKKRAAAAAKTISVVPSIATLVESVLSRLGGELDFSKEIPAIYVDTTHLPETAYERLVGRDAELKRLDDAWADNETNIISLIAEGGAGKSALVNEWLKRMQADNYRGAEAVLGWSFYSQGSKERATSAETFLNWALDKLGIKLETTSATAKADAIAEAVMQRRVLLVLDGVEPLQHGVDVQLGELKDQGLRALLRRFAATPPAQAHGLIVLTSRLPVKNIARWKEGVAPVIPVDELSNEAGAELLRDNGVWGTDRDLKAASENFGGHPLGLGLLATFLSETQFGDVRRRDHIRAFFADPENPRHDHAKRVMESYEKEWLKDKPVLLAILQIVGLFDRPASGDCLRALRAKPTIDGLTNQLVDLDDREWQRAVARLREVRLLAPVDPSMPDALDAHPLVREWFGERLKETDEAAWKAAHGRLYEHLRDATAEGETPTLEDLAPLYQSISHGCYAARHLETLVEVFMDRIWRRSENSQPAPFVGLEFYSRFKLGANGSDLAALRYFFLKPYETTFPGLDEVETAWLLAESGFALRSEGRLVEAQRALTAAFHFAKESINPINAAIRAQNLSETELLLGNVDAAMRLAEQAISYCEQMSFATAARANLAYTLLTAGEYERAKRLFPRIEQQQKKFEPKFQYLYSFRGYQYCDLLLEEGRPSATLSRARQTLASFKQHYSLHDRALDKLTIARSHLSLAIAWMARRKSAQIVADNCTNARRNFQEVVDDLRQANTIYLVPFGLLARVAFRRSIGDWAGAARDLDEVEEIAEPGPMKLFLCDMALERARLAFAQVEAFAPLNGMLEEDNPPKPVMADTAEIAQLEDDAAKQLAIAADYIEKCGYHRRDEELAELQAVLRGERKFADLPPRV